MTNTATKVQNIFSEVLQKPASEFSMEKTIFVDLGVESVEALELEFSLEEEFDISISDKDIWKLPTFIASNSLVQDNALTEDAKALIKLNYPSMSDEQIDGISNPSDLHKYLTIGDVVAYLDKRERNAA